MPVVTLSSKGQIVLPRKVREALNLQNGDRLRLTWEDDRLVLIPVARAAAQKNWRRWRGRLTGTQALESHMAEHADEICNERLP